MNTITSRTHHQVACDGIRAVWLPGTPVARESFEAPALRSMDGIVFRGTVSDVAVHLLRQDFKQATRKQQLVHAEESLTALMATMDGIHRRSAMPVTA